MSDPLLPEDIDATKHLFDELLFEVSASEGTLSGGTKLGIGTEALQSLQETRVELGHPADNLIKLTPELFESVNVSLTNIRKAQLVAQFDFYYLTLAVSLQPKRGALFNRFECSLDFGPKGGDEPIVQAIFPTSKWREVLNYGAGMALALDADLNWTAGINTPAEVVGMHIPAEIQSHIANKNTISAAIVVPDYSFKLGRAEITAMGEGNSRCFWRLENPDLQETQTLQFGIVFKVPKGTTTVELTGLCAAQPSVSWLAAKLQNVYEDISDKLKKLMALNDTKKSRLAIGDHEHWTLHLPY